MLVREFDTHSFREIDVENNYISDSMGRNGRKISGLIYFQNKGSVVLYKSGEKLILTDFLSSIAIDKSLVVQDKDEEICIICKGDSISIRKEQNRDEYNPYFPSDRDAFYSLIENLILSKDKQKVFIEVWK